MAGKDVWHVLEESATVACHHVWLLRIDHLLIAAEVFKFSGRTIRSISMIAANAVIHLEPCSGRNSSVIEPCSERNSSVIEPCSERNGSVIHFE